MSQMHLLFIEEREFVFPYWRISIVDFCTYELCIFVHEFSCKHISAFACWSCEPVWRMSNIARCILRSQKHFLERSFSQMQRDKGLHRIVLVLCSLSCPMWPQMCWKMISCISRHCRRKKAFTGNSKKIRAFPCWLRENSLFIKNAWQLGFVKICDNFYLVVTLLASGVLYHPRS